MSEVQWRRSELDSLKVASELAAVKASIEQVDWLLQWREVKAPISDVAGDLPTVGQPYLLSNKASAFIVRAE